MNFMLHFCDILHRPTPPALEIDYVRIYSDSGTCEPEGAPTKTYIAENVAKFSSSLDVPVSPAGVPKSEYPLMCVRSGGAACDAQNPHACGGPRRGSCKGGKCSCNFDGESGEGWTGPQCLAQATGAAQFCPYFLQHDASAVDSQMFIPSELCTAPLPFDATGNASDPTTGALVLMVQRNCEAVSRLYDSLYDDSRPEQAALKSRSQQAMRLCRAVMSDGVLGECCPEHRANVALKAWGEIAMNNAQCCNGLQEPFCFDVHKAADADPSPESAIPLTASFSNLNMALASFLAIMVVIAVYFWRFRTKIDSAPVIDANVEAGEGDYHSMG